MINHTKPLIFDDNEREDPILAMTRNDPRILPLILEKEHLLMTHTRMHLMGFGESEIHDRLLDRYHVVETCLNACWIGPLN